MRIRPKLNKYERRYVHAEKIKQDMGGTGLYVYENNTNADLKLPKITPEGIRALAPKGQKGCRFEGDSYYLKWVGAPMNLLRLIEEKIPKMTNQELFDHQQKQTLLEEQKNMLEKKLILDQPDCITESGKIERVVPDNHIINDNVNSKKKPEVLLNETPLDGIEIILN